MNKKIIFVLLIIVNATAYGMEKENEQTHNAPTIFFNEDLLPLITRSLCASHKFRTHYNKNKEGIRADIKTLSCTNHLLHNYYAQEKNQQSIIELCSTHNGLHYKTNADYLSLHTICKKIDRFSNIAYGQDTFTEDDKKEACYLNMPPQYCSENNQLLFIMISRNDIAGINFIIDNVPNIHIYNSNKSSLLNAIITQRYYLYMQNKHYNTPLVQSTKLLAVAQRLLQNKTIDPDEREDEMYTTPLMISVDKKDKEFTYLLLTFNADPCKTCINIHNNTHRQNAFDHEPEAGWLQNIINEVNANKNNHNQ